MCRWVSGAADLRHLSCSRFLLQTSCKNFMVAASSVVSGGAARVDLSAYSSLSFGVVCFACSTCCSISSVFVSRQWFLSSMKLVASCSFVIKSWFVELACCSIENSWFVLACRARCCKSARNFPSVRPLLRLRCLLSLDLGLRLTWLV